MGALIVQVVAHGACSLETTKSSGTPINVGSGYRNDIVLGDPFVAPEQIVIEQIETGWTVRVLDGTNEVLLNGNPISGAGTVLNSGDSITIGRTDIEVYGEDHPVEVTRKLPFSSWASPGRVMPLVAFGALACVSIADGLADYLQLSTDLEWDTYAYESLFAAVTILVWSGVWSIAGRVLRHQPYFWMQLLATMLVYVALIIIYRLVGFAEFVTGSVSIGRTANYLVAFGGLVVLLKFNLFFATNIRKTLHVAVVISCLVIGLIFARLQFAEDNFEPEPIYSGVVRPPFMHVATDRSIDEFISTAATASAQ
jgi:pSer/pThr/pTyr-binding forkhead associated (FHA) protein